MSIAFVQKVDSGNNGSGSGSSSNVSITATQGNCLVIAFHQHSSNALVSVTDTNGTPVSVVPGTVNAGVSFGLYVVGNCAGGAHSITVTFASTGWTDLVVCEYSGVNTTTPVDASGSNSGNVFGTAPSCNVVASGAAQLLFGYVHMENVAATLQSGFTSRDTFDSNQVCDMAISSSGTYAVGSPATSTSSWLVVALALRGTGMAYDPTIPFIGSVVVGNNPTPGGAEPFLGTMVVLASVPTDAQGNALRNPFLGTVHNVAVAPPGADNKKLGQIVILGSAPAGESNPFLGDIVEG